MLTTHLSNVTSNQLHLLPTNNHTGTFDPEWYTQQYPDIPLSGISAEEHYLHIGRFLGRPSCRPSDQFLQSFGAAFLGPLFALYFHNLFQRLTQLDSSPILWFLAREGYFLEKSFHKLRATLGMPTLQTHYILTSRSILFRLALSKQSLQHITLRHHFQGSLSQLLIDRYLFSSNEMSALQRVWGDGIFDSHRKVQLPQDAPFITSVLSELPDEVLSQIDHERDDYIRYLFLEGLDTLKTHHCFDLGYSGTIQQLLHALTGASFEGHYFFTTPRAHENPECPANGYIESGSCFGANSLLDLSLYLEAFLTSPKGQLHRLQFCGSNRTGLHATYGPRTRSQKSFELVTHIIDGATSYAGNAIREGSLMTPSEINAYQFIAAELIPEALSPLLDVDDHISGNAIINPKTFWRK